MYGQTDLSQPSDKAGLVDRSKLVEKDLPRFTLKSTRHTKGKVPGSRAHRCDDDRPEKLIHFVRGDDQARPSFLNFSAYRWVERDPIDLEPFHHPSGSPELRYSLLPLRTRSLYSAHHSHSLKSQAVGGHSSRGGSSPSFSREARILSSQPCRGRRADRMTRRSSWTESSTSSPKSSCSSQTLGILTPREFPIRTIRVFVTLLISISPYLLSHGGDFTSPL